MKSIELEIYENMTMYPTLVRNRFEALSDLFFLIGNGYAWVNGALVDQYPEERVQQQKVVADAVAWMKENDLEMYQKSLEMFEAKMKDLSIPEKFYLGPLSTKYANFFTVPDDVRRDHIEAALEIGLIYFKLHQEDKKILAQLSKLQKLLVAAK
jgi:hypothetical protein